MKPLEVASIADTEGEMECELHSKEFFVQVGLLIVEGRTPQHSERGRIEGKHCASLKGNTSHVCEKKDKECEEALSWSQMMETHWLSMNPVLIDVLVQLTKNPNTTILLEQWTVSVISTSNNPSTSGSQLLQAVRSHIHFSQLSAWLSLSRGAMPYSIKYRMNNQDSFFIEEPSLHIFPFASLPGQRSLQVTVKSLPRCSMQELIDALDTSSESIVDTRSPLRKRTCLKDVTSRSDRTCSITTAKKSLNVSCSSRCDKQSDLESEILPLENLGNGCTSKSDKTNVDSYVLNLGASCSNWESNGIGNLNDRIEKLGREIDQIERTIHQTDSKFSASLSKVLKDSGKDECQGKVLIKDSMFDKKTNTTCEEGKNWKSNDMTKMLLQRKFHSLSEQGSLSTSNGTACSNGEAYSNEAACSNGATCSNRAACSNGAACKQTMPFDRHQCPTRQGTASNSSDVDIHAIKQPVDRACFRRSVQLPIGACTEPVFNPQTGLPVSSSPAPLRRSTNELYEDTTDFTDGLSNKVDYRELSKLLSRSAPASTTQSLLVNFEESVLNGRMEPVGTVEGFTAELSASGSFCPRHVKLPIISCFYRLSDDDAPSPYMGYINLKDEPLGRRGYHVPKRGTVQLTVFNPNKTVVKMFVVLYDCSDMPPKSQTFLRQKTYSALKGNVVKNEVQQTLHYLLHLRFASSKSGKIYLHTDIRVIFARQPPDLGHLYELYTITDGPTDPKYTKRHHVVMDPEC